MFNQKTLWIIFIMFSLVHSASAQFMDQFASQVMIHDSTAISGWDFFTGDGSAVMTFDQSNGIASIHVDATQDRENIWWALIRRAVSADFDMARLCQPEYELRIKARIRTSQAPRRVNLHLNTQRTTDFHSHLMEYDIPDTTEWHTISMTTHDFDVQPKDTICGQLALMDWGLGKYRVDLDYFKVDVVCKDSVGPDLGTPLPYRPPIPPVNSFSYHVPVIQDAMIDKRYPDENFNHWHVTENARDIILLSVNHSQNIIMCWDLSRFKGKHVKGLGLLELTTHSVQRFDDRRKDFGMIRIKEILKGDPAWNQETVTFNSLCNGDIPEEVINTQMIIDVRVSPNRDSANLITLSQPVMQRLIEGKTLGMAVLPLGPIHASFYAMENRDDQVIARLHFNTE